MDERNLVLLVSGFLLSISFFGVFLERNILKTLISIEIMTISSILNFCYFSTEYNDFGELAAISIFVISGIIFCVLFAIYSFKHLSQSDDKRDL